jgi:tRNA threonylcarbamoyladenosine biosynthesis protein TsaE
LIDSEPGIGQAPKAESAAFRLATPEETRRWGAALGRLLRPGDLIALHGDLGAGKTTLTQGIAAGMGIRDEVTSPTFTLLHEYRGPLPLFHLDPYRLERPGDVYDLGFEEYLERGGVTVIEWADRLEGVLPAERLALAIEIIPASLTMGDEGAEGDGIAVRRIIVTATGDRYRQLLAAMIAKEKDLHNTATEHPN